MTLVESMGQYAAQESYVSPSYIHQTSDETNTKSSPFFLPFFEHSRAFIERQPTICLGSTSVVNISITLIYLLSGCIKILYRSQKNSEMPISKPKYGVLGILLVVASSASIGSCFTTNTAGSGSISKSQRLPGAFRSRGTAPARISLSESRSTNSLHRVCLKHDTNSRGRQYQVQRQGFQMSPSKSYFGKLRDESGKDYRWIRPFSKLTRYGGGRCCFVS